jgi:hypothetical protein
LPVGVVDGGSEDDIASEGELDVEHGGAGEVGVDGHSHAWDALEVVRAAGELRHELNIRQSARDEVPIESPTLKE